MFPVVFMACVWRLHRTQSSPRTDTVKNLWFFLSTLSPPLLGADSSFVQHSIWLTVDPEPGAEDGNSRTRSPSPCLLCDAVCVKCLVTAMHVMHENAPVTTGLLPRCYTCNFIMNLPLVFTPQKVLYPRPLHSEASIL